MIRYCVPHNVNRLQFLLILFYNLCRHDDLILLCSFVFELLAGINFSILLLRSDANSFLFGEIPHVASSARCMLL